MTPSVTAVSDRVARRGDGRKAGVNSGRPFSWLTTERGSLTGLTEHEAKEFHGMFVTSFIVFTVIAIIAHFLVWQWRPWLGSGKGPSQCPLRGLTDHRR